MAAPVSLASGYGSFAVPPLALQAATSALASLRGPLPVGDAAGTPALREALAARYRQRGAARVQAAHIVVTPGAKAALFAVLSEVLQTGGTTEVLLPTPNWFGFGELVRLAGGQLREWPLSAATAYALDPAALRRALTPTTRVLLLSNPNNPTGRLYTRQEWAALLEVTREHPGLVVISDEIYEGIVFGSPGADYAPAPTLLALPDPHGQHLVVSGFSKSLGLAGWGVGYVAGPPALAAAVAARQFSTAGPVPAPNQAAALAATQHADAIGQHLCHLLQPNRQILLAGLRALPGQPPFGAPEGTYYVFADFSRWLLPARPPAAASAALAADLAAAGVLAVDGGTCGAPGFFRLSYAVPAADLREALHRLGIFAASR